MIYAFLLASILSLAVFVLTLTHFLKKVKFHRHLLLDLALSALGSSYLIFAILLYLWSQEHVPYTPTDFLILYALVLIIQTLSILGIHYFYHRQKNILYSIIGLIIIIPLLSYHTNYLHFIIPLCYLATLFSYLIVLTPSQRTTMRVIAYASFSLLAYAAIYLFNLPSIWAYSASLFFFLYFYLALLYDLKNNIRPLSYRQPEEERSPILFLKHFIFIIIITNFVLIGTIGVHELGHLAASSAFEECGRSKLVYELGQFPHTEVTCTHYTYQELWIIAGIILPFILAILFFFVGGTSMRELALEIIGFNIILSYLDFLALDLSPAIASFFMIGGIVLVIYSLVLLARLRTQ